MTFFSMAYYKLDVRQPEAQLAKICPSNVHSHLSLPLSHLIAELVALA